MPIFSLFDLEANLNIKRKMFEGQRLVDEDLYELAEYICDS